MENTDREQGYIIFHNIEDEGHTMKLQVTGLTQTKGSKVLCATQLNCGTFCHSMTWIAQALIGLEIF